MGGLFAKPTTLKITDINTITNKVLTNYSPNVSSSGVYTNVIEASGGSSTNNNNQNITVGNTLRAVYDLSQTDTFKTDIKTNISQELKKETVALISDIGSIFRDKNEKLDTTLDNGVENLHITEIVPTCISNQTLTNSILASGASSASGNTQNITANFYQECLGNVTSTMNTTSDLANTINQKADIKDKNPLDFIGDMFKGLMSTILIIIVVVIAGIFLMSSGGGGMQKIQVTSAA